MIAQADRREGKNDIKALINGVALKRNIGRYLDS